MTWRLGVWYGALFLIIGLVTPYWPVWLAGQGLSAADVGVVLSAGLAAKVVGNLLWPRLADHWGRPRATMTALALAGLAGYGLFAPGPGFWGLLILQMWVWACIAPLMPLGDALTLQVTRGGRVDYGRVRLWGSASFILAAVAGGAWFEGRPADWILVLVIASVALTAAATRLLPAGQAGPAIGSGLRDLLRHGELRWFVLAAGLVQASHAAYYAYATLHWQAAGLSEGLIGLFWGEGVVAEILLFLVGSRVLARLGPLRLMMVAAGLATLRWTVTAVTTEPAVLAMVQLLHAASFGATHLAAMGYLTTRVPAPLLATAQGLYGALGMGVIFAGATLIAAELYGQAGGAAFLAMAIQAAAGGLIALGLWRRGR